jgi:hypothetical protein
MFESCRAHAQREGGFHHPPYFGLDLLRTRKRAGVTRAVGVARQPVTVPRFNHRLAYVRATDVEVVG